MKKIKIFRMSGLPVKEDQLDAYREEWKSGFDKYEKKHGKDMLSLQEDLAKLENELNDKYKTIEEIDFIKTKKAWSDLMDEYGNIMVSRHRDTGEILYIIIDEETHMLG